MKFIKMNPYDAHLSDFPDLKMTHQRNGWSPVTGNQRTAPIVIVRGPVKEKINFAFSFYFLSD